MTRHLDRRGAAVVGIRHGKPSRVGSGTCITIGGRFFVATAAHVIDGFTLDALTLIHTAAPSDGRVPFCRFGSRGGGTVNALFDLAWLEIEPRHARTVEKEFVEIERFDTSPIAEPTNVVVHGYPISETNFAKRTLRVQAVCYSTLTTDVEEFPPGRDTVTNVYLDYPADGNIKTDGASVDAPSPGGISGAGVWDMRINHNGIWSAEFATIRGIQRSTCPDRQVLRGTPISHWLRLLRHDVPELTSSIGLIP